MYMMGIKEIYYRLKYGIFNLVYYFKVIWNDRHWDPYFFYILLKKKLEGMEKFFTNKAGYVGREKDVKRIPFCIRCLNRLIEDNYMDPENNIVKIYGNHIFKVADEKGMVEMTRSKVESGERREEDYWKDFRKYMDRSINSELRDIRLLFKVIEMNIQRWWD